MPQSATLQTGGSGGGFESLPTPVKIGLIGGGLGLAFFLWKRANSGGGGGGGGPDSNDPLINSGYGIPNTAVMLGSLQQEMLQLMGQQGADTANLTDLLTGGFSNMASMFDAQTGQFQLGLTDLQNAIIDNQNANTKSILDSLAARSDLLTQLINTSSGAEQAAFQSFADSTAKGLGSIAAQQNAEMAAIGALGQNVTTAQADIIGKLQGLQQTTAGLYSQGAATQQLIAALPNPAAFYFLSKAEQQPYLNVEKGDFQKAATHWANDAAAAVLDFQRKNPQLVAGSPGANYIGFTR